MIKESSESFLDIARTCYPQWLSESWRSEVKPSHIYKPWQLKMMSQEEFRSLSEAEQMSYISSWMILAPTTHNTVSERFLFNVNPSTALQMDIWTDRKYILSGSDGFGPGRQNMVSMGCVAETGIAAGAAYGWGASVDMLADRPIAPLEMGGDRYMPVARITFQPEKFAPFGTEYLRVLHDRKMVRANYDQRVRIESSAIQNLKKIADAYDLSLFILETGPSESAGFKTKASITQRTIQTIGYLQEYAMATVLKDPNFSHELGSYFLPEDEEVSDRKMRSNEFLLDVKTGRRLHQGLTETLPNGDMLQEEEVKGFARNEGRLLRNCSAIGIITVPLDTPANQFKAGRAFIDIAHYLSHSARGHIIRGNNKVYLQGGFRTSMHAALAEVDIANAPLQASLDIYQSKTNKIDVMDHVKMFVKSAKNLILSDSGRPTVIFRIGIPRNEEDDKVSHSARPHLESLLHPVSLI